MVPLVYLSLCAAQVLKSIMDAFRNFEFGENMPLASLTDTPIFDKKPWGCYTTGPVNSWIDNVLLLKEVRSTDVDSRF